MSLRSCFAASLALLAFATSSSLARTDSPGIDDRAAPIRVVVWDEQQPEQKSAYDEFLGRHLTDHLNRLPGIRADLATPELPGKGLSTEILDQCDVLIWWGHVRHHEITAEDIAPVVERVKQGKLAFLGLHSAHWAQPFVSLMHERAVQDALSQLAPEERSRATVEFVGGWERRPPARTEPLTPAATFVRGEDGSIRIELTRPNCCFPAYRNDGQPSRLRVVASEHPIAAGLPPTFELPHTEMYDEPFHVPEPDVVLFEERWEAGERFRSGMLWRVGRGEVFYFRPGHETHRVFHEPVALQVLENAVRHLGGNVRSGGVPPLATAENLAVERLVPWCIVPFDAAGRGPEERAAMVAKLGMKRVAYDWRDQHVAEFEDEILAYRRHGLEFFAFWSWHPALEPLIEKYGIRPQIWTIVPSPEGATNDEKVAEAARQLLPLVETTRRLGLSLGLYNHGGWGGEPENMAAVCRYLRTEHDAPHVGIVYNFHHGHAHVPNFAERFDAMSGLLICVNLNGMLDPADHDVNDQRFKIVPIGSGRHERRMLDAVIASGYSGPIGILDHRDDLDSEVALRRNLDGLAELLRESR